MSIYIEKIVFENYRQFGNMVLRFDSSKNNSLSVIVAKNGTGKTTLLNAITWCLYGKELQTNASASDVLPSINTSYISAQNVGAIVKAAVAITVIDDSKTLEFRRTISYKISENGGKVSAVKGTGTFTATLTNGVGLENTSVKQDADADVLVKQYFDEAIYNFYFFDGEKLGEFFDLGRTKDIKESIFNISQISLLDNAITHSEKIRFELSKKNSVEGSDLDELYSRRDELNQAIETNEKQKEASQKKVDKLTKKIEEYDEKLKTYLPIQQLQHERGVKEGDLDSLEREEAVLSTERSAFLRKYLTLISLYPRIKRVLGIISDKEKKGDLPPVIDSDLIRKILVNHEKECPLCAGKIDEAAVAHLQAVLESISLSSETSNNLKEIKGPLEDYLDSITNFVKERDSLRDKAIDLTERKKALKKRLDEISKLLAGFNDGDDAEIIAGIEKNRRTALAARDKENQTLGAAKIQIVNMRGELKEVLAEIKELESKKKEFKALKKTLDTYDMLCAHFSSIKDSIMTGMKAEIASTTWDIFSSMIWKQNTFGKIDIDDDYVVTVFDKSGHRMTGSLSATEQMALAYAFTLAIHKASGKNCPLVIDSPLGRVSDDNRINMARVLLDISKEKQIIMLFTPDEFSDSVKKIYTHNAQITELSLSNDEQYVEVTTK